MTLMEDPLATPRRPQTTAPTTQTSLTPKEKTAEKIREETSSIERRLLATAYVGVSFLVWVLQGAFYPLKRTYYFYSRLCQLFEIFDDEPLAMIATVLTWFPIILGSIILIESLIIG